MISGIFHQGSGLGNQLARYVAVRCLALDKDYRFGMLGCERFKGRLFMDLPFGELVRYKQEWYEQKIINEDGNDVREYDPRILDVEDFTFIDGEFQAPEYFMHHLDEIREWLKVNPINYSDNLCIINFRGGEYVGVKDLFLPKEYWDLAIKKMLEINPNMRFEVHTDDRYTAEKFFPDYVVVQNIGINWRSIRYAKYLILSNSSFAILPALLNEDVKEIIAPKFWAGYNKGYWQLPQNNYKQFTYVHHED